MIETGAQLQRLQRRGVVRQTEPELGDEQHHFEVRFEAANDKSQGQQDDEEPDHTRTNQEPANQNSRFELGLGFLSPARAIKSNALMVL